MTESLRVLFVCVSNRGKSVMAERLTPTITSVLTATSAGTEATTGGVINPLSARVLAEVGADPHGHEPRQLTDELTRASDLVVVVGPAVVTPPEGVELEVWDTVEPSDRGPRLRPIDGLERMRMIRGDISDRIAALADRVGAHPKQPPATDISTRPTANGT